ncbi:MAG: 2-amino-4-hydroxy-6-hydroxymethyldihydropteridine diphosphokinase [Candidatus Cloacimonetes bacterium]|nr:2-amino-4-hydroxy-6-hydroxymethyldihydropteridine diphosphokinase [Candidatus Cloacimonadota bacterium]
MQLALACKEIAALAESSIVRETRVLRTKPYGKTDQGDFYNMVLELESSLEPNVLLEKLLLIEQRMGRIRTEKWGPRVIDIDILLADDTIMNESELCIPHSDLQNRAFALFLLCELVPDAIHPVYNRTMRELLYSLPGGYT